MGGSDVGLIDEVVSDDGSARSKGTKKDAPKSENAASVQETLSFAFNGPSNTNSLFVAGVIGAIANGMVSRSPPSTFIRIAINLRNGS